MTYSVLNPHTNDDSTVFAALADVGGVWLPQHPDAPLLHGGAALVAGMDHDSLVHMLANVLVERTCEHDCVLIDALRRELARRHAADPLPDVVERVRHYAP